MNIFFLVIPNYNVDIYYEDWSKKMGGGIFNG